MLRAAAEPYPVNPFHWFALVETTSHYQTGSVNTWSETVDTSDQDDVIFKPPVTPAVMAAKRSWSGRVYLDWARFPLVEDPGHANLVASDELVPEPLDTAVEFSDLRFAYPILSRGGSVSTRTLTAWDYIAPDGPSTPW